MIRVTETWSGKRLGLRKPWRALRTFDVSGTSDVGAALVAVDPVTSLAIPQRGDGHPSNTTRLKCEGPEVAEVKGPEYFVIACEYSEGAKEPTEDDPLDEQPLISWDPAEITIPVDHDLDNQPIVNSVGEFQDASRTISFKRLTIVKNFPFYDKGLSDDYENAVNSAPISLSGVDTVPAQHMRCVTINPARREYPPDVEFLPIAFVFEIMADLVLGLYPFQHRFIDEGRAGWYGSGTNKAQGVFANKDGPMDARVKLDGTGLPLQKLYGTSVFVGSPVSGGSNTATTPPIACHPFAKEYYKADGTFATSLSNTLTEAVALYYKGARVVDFSPLTGLL